MDFFIGIQNTTRRSLLTSPTGNRPADGRVLCLHCTSVDPSPKHPSQAPSYAPMGMGWQIYGQVGVVCWRSGKKCRTPKLRCKGKTEKWIRFSSSEREIQKGRNDDFSLFLILPQYGREGDATKSAIIDPPRLMTADEKHGRFYLFPRRIPHQLPN